MSDVCLWKYPDPQMDKLKDGKQQKEYASSMIYLQMRSRPGYGDYTVGEDSAFRLWSEACVQTLLGIGGTFDKAALLAKKAIMRPLNTSHPDPYYADLEKEMLEKVNELGIGPQGFGGKTTAIGLNIETLPTHIAGMPCAININCHVTRHKSEVL